MAIKLLSTPHAHTTPSSNLIRPAAAEDTVTSQMPATNWSLLACFLLVLCQMRHRIYT